MVVVVNVVVSFNYIALPITTLDILSFFTLEGYSTIAISIKIMKL